MPRFTYVALDSRGQESTGLVEAASPNEAIGQLRQAGFFPTNVYEEGKGGGRDGKAAKRVAKAARVAQPREKRKGIVLFQRKKVKPKILMIFTRQLATLIDSGLPLLRALNVLAKQERDSVLKNTIDKLAESVQGGSTFSERLGPAAVVEVGGVAASLLTRLTANWRGGLSHGGCGLFTGSAGAGLARRGRAGLDATDIRKSPGNAARAVGRSVRDTDRQRPQCRRDRRLARGTQCPDPPATGD